MSTIQHPCINGLTKACFTAYPQWARQALAYKLLHILIPKQATKLLPRGLRGPLVPSGAIIPPGIDLQPGGVLPPDFPTPEVPDIETPTLPPILQPPDPTFDPDYPPGVPPPILIPPWEPGPIQGPGPIIQPPAAAELLHEEADPTSSWTWGQVVEWILDVQQINASISAQVESIQAKIGKFGSPTGNVTMEIRTLGGTGNPDTLVTNGASDPVLAADLPDFDVSQDYITFTFPDLPELSTSETYYLALKRSTSPSAQNYYKIGSSSDGNIDIEREHVTHNWQTFLDGRWSIKIYGYPL